jgi:hypothetical protein
MLFVGKLREVQNYCTTTNPRYKCIGLPRIKNGIAKNRMIIRMTSVLIIAETVNQTK